MALTNPLRKKSTTTLSDTLAIKAADRQVDADLSATEAETARQDGADAYASFMAKAAKAERDSIVADKEAAALLKAKAILDEAGVTL